MKENQNIALLILAAGESRRMGNKIKQLLPWKNTTLLGNAINQAKKTEVRDIFVVLGANIKEIKTTLDDESITILENNNWKSGMGSSIVTGIRHLNSSNHKYDGALVILTDQPQPIKTE